MNSEKKSSAAVLHLRTSVGGGGGPEKTIINTGRLIDRNQITYLVGYLCKHGEDLSPTANRAREAGLEYFEFPGRRFVDPGQARAILQLVKDRNIQIIHSHEPKSDFFALLLSLVRPRLKIVTTLHGWVLKPSLKSRFYLWLDRVMLRYFDLVITVSSELNREAQKRGARSRLIYNAVDVDYWKKDGFATKGRPPVKAMADRFLIGFVGRLSPEKGAVDFLRIAARIIKIDDETDFVIAGDGPDEPAMRAYAEQNGLRDRVRFLGRIDEGSTLALYRRLDCLLSPSLTEGLPNTLLEALAVGTPIIATDVGGVGELIKHESNGFLSRPGDLDSMASQALTLKRYPELAESFVSRGRALVERKFSFKNRVAALETIYLDLAGKKDVSGI